MQNPFSRGAFGQAPDLSAYGVGQGGREANAPDERVRQALEAREWPYEVSPSYNFRVVVNYPAEGRTQLVIIASATGTYRDREWRKVWSEAFAVAGRLSQEQALALLLDTDRHVCGGWYIEERDGRTAAYFQVSLPADAAPAELEDVIWLVAEVADDMEKATVGTDTM